MTLSTVLFTNKKLFEMFIPFYKNSKIQVEVIFEPKINRIVLIPDQEKLSESKLDFNYSLKLKLTIGMVSGLLPSILIPTFLSIG